MAPKRFAEMVGQEHVLRALSNALDSGKVHHAFLFTGTRGVGKTTVARILAKSLNCETAGVSSNPCGVCAACREIDEGRFVDLIEVDAASRTKVDDTRDMLDNVQYAPTRGRYKVYSSTKLSANLAYVLATGGKRVLLIDGDLRRGRLHRYLGGKRTPGLSEVVSGQCPLADATRKTGQENLEFIATGKLPPNPAELVGSPRFSAFLTDVAKRYDLVLLDTPPILAVTTAP